MDLPSESDTPFIDQSKINDINDQFIQYVCQQLATRRIFFYLVYIQPNTDGTANVKETHNLKDVHKKHIGRIAAKTLQGKSQNNKDKGSSDQDKEKV